MTVPRRPADRLKRGAALAAALGGVTLVTAGCVSNQVAPVAAASPSPPAVVAVVVPSPSVSTQYVPVPGKTTYVTVDSPRAASFCVIGHNGARMRTGPGSSFAEVMLIPEGSCAVYDAGAEMGYGGPAVQWGPAKTGETVAWRLVSVGDGTGWVIDDYLR